MGARIDASIVSARGVISPSSLPCAPPTPQPRQSDRTSPHIQPPRPPTGAVQASRVRDRDALLEAIERPTRLEVPVDSRIERGRTSLHALAQLIEHERFDRIVVPAQTSRSDGFPPDDIAWLLERAPGEVAVLRPDGVARRRSRTEAAVPWTRGPRTPAAEGSNQRAPRKCSIKSPRLSRVRCGNRMK
jgi:hypothetical protein